MKFYRGRTDSADRDAAARMESCLAAQKVENDLKSGEQSGERVLHLARDCKQNNVAATL
jgi:hypothetical protein